MPLAIKFFLSFETLSTQTSMPIQLEARVSEYLSLIMVFMIAFGLSFELPVLLILLATVGFVDSKYLSERRRYVIVIIFIDLSINSINFLLKPSDSFVKYFFFQFSLKRLFL